MDYVKSGDLGIGVLIKHHKWVEEMEIRDQISELFQWSATDVAGGIQ